MSGGLPVGTSKFINLTFVTPGQEFSKIAGNAFLDLWDFAGTQTLLNAGNFGVRLFASSSGVNATIELDAVAVTVCYNS